MPEVVVHDLKLIADSRGWLMECVRSDAPWFKGFGQVYITLCYPGVVKAWHRHQVHTDTFICVQGMARVAVTGDSPSARLEVGVPIVWSYYAAPPQEFVIGLLNPKVLIIPPGLWHGFAAVGSESCLVLNVPDRVYDQADEERLPWDAIPFNWRDVNG